MWGRDSPMSYAGGSGPGFPEVLSGYGVSMATTPVPVPTATTTLTQPQMKELATAMLAELKTYSEWGYIPDDPHPYKPFYRATAILLGGGRESLPSTLVGLDRPVTVAEAKVILSFAHPYFAGHIARDPGHYETVYDFHYETWGDEYHWQGDEVADAEDQAEGAKTC